jgi:hypothetical protein
VIDENEKADRVIAAFPPQDGREWECQCARCGSSATFEECEACGGEGLRGHDCGDDTCCCLRPEENQTCGDCGGVEGWWCCLSSRDWCEAHPIPGREKTERGEIEWFPWGPTT